MLLRPELVEGGRRRRRMRSDELLRLKIDNAFEGLFSKEQKEEMEEQIFIRSISTAPSPNGEGEGG